MKRIALFVNSLQKGGSERVMANLAEYFHSKNYEVILVTQYKKEIEYVISPKIRRVYSEPPAEELNDNRIHNFIVRFKTLRNIWKVYKPDVILAFLGKNNQMAILTSFFLPSKVAVSVRGEPILEYPGKLNKIFTNILFSLADGVIFQTKEASEFFWKSVVDNSTIIPNPLNPAFIGKRYYGEKDNVIISVARLHETKNQKLLINAFEKIADQFPNINLVMYGEGETREYLETLIKEKKMEHRMSLPGTITNMPEVLGRAKVFVHPSNSEGIPNAIMEAMAVGLPVIVTDCPSGGPGELVQNGENGILIPMEDVDGLANAMIKVLTDEEYAKKLGDNACKIVDILHPDMVNQMWENYLSNL